LLETWSGAGSPGDLLVARGRVYVTGGTNPGQLYEIDPSLPAGAVTTVANNLGGSPAGIAFDGTRIWTANAGGTVSILTPGTLWTVTTASGGYQAPRGILYDGSSIWIVDNRGGGSDFGALLKLDGAGGILQTVTVGIGPAFPVFDGSNIWVPDALSGVSVVRASTGVVLKSLAAAGFGAAFDGQRVLVGNALYKAADLTLLQTLPFGGVSACSDGMSFWIALGTRVARY
jgi:DNA-binding beta-propeller fold protein YncE